MRRLILIGFGIALALNTPVAAQQASQNIPVLPLIPNDGGDTWYLEGDGFLQRQVEPTIAVSTRNPDHLLSFFNDYRAVDLPDDVGIGEGERIAVLTLKIVDFMMAGLLPPIADIPLAPPTAAAEAWVGGSRSYDGGLTWSGFFMPGSPEDLSDASVDSPVYGLEAATDPVAVAGPCGYVYVVFVAFTRGENSKLVVARFQDLNNDEGGDTWEYQGMTVLETGNNAEYGYFLDKPHINLDPFRSAGDQSTYGANFEDGAQCGHRVYASYSTFNGLSKDGKIQTKVNFGVSTDGGKTFATQKINKNWGQNQGSFIAVDPRAGTPERTGGPGTVYVFWRHFFDPNTIVMTRTTDYGVKWSNPVSILGSTPMAPFDQPTISTELGNPDLLTFRSNGFPTAAVTSDGTVFAAWQESVNIDADNGDLGVPRPYDPEESPPSSPRIVLTRSGNGGATWTGPWVEDPDNPGTGDYWPIRRAVDFADRDVSCDPEDPDYPNVCQQPPGFGALPDERASGPQVMPWLSYGGGRLALVYYESRGLLGGGDIGIQDQDISPSTGFVSGIDRVVDFRASLLEPSTGQLLGTTQVSRYPISATAELADGEQVADVARVAPAGCGDGSGWPEYCQPSLNLVNKPQSAAGTSPFIGDYPGATPIVQFVYDKNLFGGDMHGWRWATEPDDVPYRAFHTVFADNRHLVPPTEGGGFEWQRYPLYGPPGFGDSCSNPGSRNTDVLTARVEADLIVSAPTTYKQLEGFQRGFPIRLQNGTDTTRSYHLEISQGAGYASFSSSDPDIDSSDPDVEIFPYSSVSQVVYVDSDATGAVRVDVTEIGGGGATGSVTFNADPSNPDLTNLDGGDTTNPFVLNPFVLNPFVLNPFVLNGGATNLSPSNPFVLNPFVLNPFVLNSAPSEGAAKSALKSDSGPMAYEVIDTRWEVGASGNTAGSYLPVINIDNAEQYVGNYAFQLIVYKTSSYAGANDACESYEVRQDQVISNVAENPFVLNPFVLNPFVLNPFVLNSDPANPFVLNPFVLNPFVLNSTFTVAPSDSTKQAAKAIGAPGGEFLGAVPEDKTYLLLRAFRLKPYCDEPGADQNACIGPGKALEFKPNEDPPSAAVASMTCLQEAATQGDASLCFDYVAPDLVPTVAGAQPTTFQPGADLIFPVGGWTLSNQGTADAVAENRELRHGFYLRSEAVDPQTKEPLFSAELGTVTAVDGNGDVINSLAQGEQQSFAPSVLAIPADIPPGPYTLTLYVDDLEEVSEFDETNNVIYFQIRSNSSPTVSDASFTTDEDQPLTASLLAPDCQIACDADGDQLTFTVVGGPSHGSVAFSDTVPGEFTYTPDLNFNGIDSFTYKASDGYDESAIATVTITVLPVTDFVFDGFFNPWTETPAYSANAGSAIPLKWRYLDQAGTVVVDSSSFDPTIQSTFYEKTQTTCPAYSDTTGVRKFITTDPDDPGSSDLRYSTLDNEWQLNWATPEETGCYYLRVFNNEPGLGLEVSRPLLIILK